MEHFVALEQPLGFPLHNVADYEDELSRNRDVADIWTKPHIPAAVKNLMHLPVFTRLDALLTMGSPAMILMCSNFRQCTSSRAPAIMSAISVTDWYQAGVASATSNNTRSD